MNRRTFIQVILAAVSSVVFTATGWLMGAGALTMSSGGAPCPPGNLNDWTPCVKISCSVSCGIHLCDYRCGADGTAEFWWACGNGPCSDGFCDYESDPGGCVPP